jgi:hypothetical protein
MLAPATRLILAAGTLAGLAGAVSAAIALPGPIATTEIQDDCSNPVRSSCG